MKPFRTHTPTPPRTETKLAVLVAAALFAASTAGCAEISQMLRGIDDAVLVALGGQPKSANAGSAQGGKTALMQAAETGDVSTVERLIAGGANVNEKIKAFQRDGAPYIYTGDDGGNTALLFAARNGHIDVVERLIAAGADVNAGGGFCCVDASDECEEIANPLGAAIENGHVEVVKTLLKNKADASQGLMHAASKGNAAMVGTLLNHGAKVNSTDGFGSTPLIAAIGSGNVETVKLLLDKGANPNASLDFDEEGSTGARGESALAVAAAGGNADIVRLLLKKGAKVNYRFKAGGLIGPTALEAAQENGRTEIIRILKAAGAKDGKKR